MESMPFRAGPGMLRAFGQRILAPGTIFGGVNAQGQAAYKVECITIDSIQLINISNSASICIIQTSSAQVLVRQNVQPNSTWAIDYDGGLPLPSGDFLTGLSTVDSAVNYLIHGSISMGEVA